MDEKKEKIITLLIVVGLLLLFAYLTWANTNTDKGEYDYCIEWESVDEEGLRMGVLHRDSLLYTCYSLAKLEFLCDYEILDDNRLVIKPITNITYEGGVITSITYGDSNYFNCIRWLKSKNI